MAVESRLLTDSISFALTADNWAITRGLLDGAGDPTSTYPAIIGVPNNAADLGAFNIGIITSNRTIKQAFQDLETAVNGRMFAGNNLSDLTNASTARTNLGLGSAATWNVGTTGAVVPLLNTINTWAGRQNFTGGISADVNSYLTSGAGVQAFHWLNTGSTPRWAIVKGADPESGSNNGSHFYISRYSDTGAWIDNPFQIQRNTGVVNLGQPLPITSGGTGGNTLGTARIALNINNVDNTSDVNKPVSNAVNTALLDKYDKAGGNIAGFVSASNYITSSSFVRGSALICSGGSVEGGQITLGYKNNLTPTGEDPGTWNIDADADSNFRIFTRKSDGTYTTDIVKITQAGLTTIKNLTVTGLDFPLRVRSSGSAFSILGVSNGGVSSGQEGTNAVVFENENYISVSSVASLIKTNGSSSVSIAVTPAGGRTTDRRSEVVVIDSSQATFTVPINGRAYPRRSDGTNINFTWAGQFSAPSWIIGSNNGVDFLPHNPSDVSVGRLGGIVGGDSGGYIRRDASGTPNGALANQLIVSGSGPTNDVWANPIQIREVGNVGNSQNGSIYAPGITFHWNSTVAASIKMHSDGSIRFQQQNTTLSYQTVWTGQLNVNSNINILNDQPVFWSNRGRGVNVADAGSGYGNITTWGPGVNNWQGYSIGTWASFMSDGADTGIYSQSYGNWLLRFDSSKNAIFAQNVTAYSDERLKQNMRPIDNVASRREGMAKAAIIYEREGHTRIGFGAQTLEPYVPEVVNTTDDLVGTKTVDYASTVAILAVDNQMLSDRIDSQNTIIEDLENKYNTLLARLEKAGL